MSKDFGGDIKVIPPADVRAAAGIIGAKITMQDPFHAVAKIRVISGVDLFEDHRVVILNEPVQGIRRFRLEGSTTGIARPLMGDAYEPVDTKVWHYGYFR